MMKKKYKKINLVLTIIPVMVVILLLIAGSYAIFSTDLNPTKVHTLTIGDLYAAKLSITDDGYVNLINAVPLSNDLGMKGDATNLTLENVGDITATYSIILLDDKTEYADYSGSVLPDTVIKYGITRNHNVNSTISLLSDATEYCSDSSIETYSACKVSSSAESGRIIMTGRLAVDESVDYKLRLWINYSAGNTYQENRYYGQVKVIIGKDLEIDTNKPYIVLNGDREVSLDVGENYYEQGILAALDKEDGDVSNTLSITDNIDISTPGIYRVSYSVYDSNNQYGFATRTVIVKNPIDCGITFTLVGDNPLSQLLGTTYSEQGATAVDSNSNSLTVTSNSMGLDVDTIGQYHVIYSATSGTCTDYTYRLVEVTMGSGGYIIYSPDETNNVWSSDNITASIDISDNITGITPASIKYKIGTYVNDVITYGNEVTVLANALPTTYTFSTTGEYIISSTLVTTTSLEISNLMSQKYYIDKTSPSCGTPTYASSPTLSDPATWVSTNRSISITSCTDSHSGCNGSSLSKIFSETSQTGTITIRDKASPNPNTATCMVNVYVDKTPPVCGTITNANTTWTTTLTNPIIVNCSDTSSGCSSSTFSSSFAGYTGQTGTITISDSASPSNTASCTVNTYMDNSTPTAPTISATSNGSSYTSGSWVNTSVSLSISGGNALSGLNTYQYCISSTNSSSSCSWVDGSSTTISNQGTYYVFARYVSNVGKMGIITSPFVVKIG
ncbi:MAG TPA: DUF5011 domain-containing protein [Bacilli bacterium]|nr:DUF5011 domain-containing protein [Bacilli bacterium]